MAIPIETTLTILKFSGTAVSGAIGILGTVTETHEEIEVKPKKPSDPVRTVKRLSRWGRWALGLTISGLVLALGAQVAEEIQGSREARKAEKRSQLQVDALLAMLTRFDKISIETVFELPDSEAKVEGLAAELHSLATHSLSELRGMRGTNFPTHWSKSPDGSVSIPLTELDEVKIPSVKALHDVFEALQVAPAVVRINRDPKATYNLDDVSKPEAADFIASASSSMSSSGTSGYLAYSSKSRRVLVHPAGFECTADNWWSNGKVVGLHDLTGAQFVLSILTSATNSSSLQLLSKVRPVWVNVRFGNHFFTLDHFKASTGRMTTGRGDTEVNTQIYDYEAVLPDSDAIMSGKVRKPRPQ